MRIAPAALALLLAVSLVPSSTAALTFNAPDAPELEITGTQTLTFSAELDCSEFVEGPVGSGTVPTDPGTDTRTINITYPVGFSGPATIDAEFDGEECLPPADASTETAKADNLTIEITPNAGARGVEVQNLELASGDATGQVPFTVKYRFGYTLDVQQEFPITLEKDENGEWMPAEWTGTITVTSNADTMVMMSVPSDGRAQFGTIDGLFANSPKNFVDMTDEQVENGITQTVTFRYTPTSDEWTEDSVTFTTWSHYFKNGTMKTDDQVVTWTFVNGAVEDSQGSPGFEATAMILAFVGVAVALRRRS